jgi:hypothetical protein
MSEPGDRFQDDLTDEALKAGADASRAETEAPGTELGRTNVESKQASKPIPWRRQREYKSGVMKVVEYAIRKLGGGVG